MDDTYQEMVIVADVPQWRRCSLYMWEAEGSIFVGCMNFCLFIFIYYFFFYQCMHVYPPPQKKKNQKVVLARSNTCVLKKSSGAFNRSRICLVL